MAYGVTKERGAQFGAESPAGTPHAATFIWRGPANSIQDTRKIDNVGERENVRYSAPLARLNMPEIGAAYTMPDAEVTFEQGPVILNASIRPLLTGVADTGVGHTAVIYAFPFPTTVSDHTFTPYTIEAGNNNLAHYMEYSFADKWGMSGVSNQAVKWTGVHFTGRQRTAQAFTGGLTPAAIEVVNFNQGKLYVNNSYATLGNTQYVNGWLGFNLACMPGLLAQPTGDGQLYFSFVKPTGVKMTGDLTVEDDSDATGLETDWVAKTIKYVRMKFEGSALVGATYTKKTLIIDQCLYISSIDTLTSQNGNDTKKVHFSTVYDGTALFANMTFVNALAALP